jgi:1-acyl-sn-glycerol-3-phosphate acyltransferase
MSRGGPTRDSPDAVQDALVLLRSTLFALALIVVTPPYSLLALATFPLPPLARYRVISGWSRLVIRLARLLLGIRYTVQGLEHLPRGPAIILSKHQSAWETLAFQAIFPPQVLVLKRSLLWIPFFGWGLALMSPIAIDRGRGARALKRMAKVGARRLAQGFWIAVFPEGTRTAPGTRGVYHPGGAWLAVHTGTPVIPVAHNAGMFWGRNAFLKRPGEVVVVVGEPMRPAGLSAEALNSKVEDWIETRMETLCRAA